MTNDQQRIKAYQAFGVDVNLAIDELHDRLSVLAEPAWLTIPEPGTRVENQSDDPKLMGMVCNGVDLQEPDEGWVWVAWEDGQVCTEYIADLIVLL